MTRIAATHRSALVALAVAAVIVTVCLVIAGLQAIPARTYSLRVPDSGSVAVTHGSQPVCEGPIRSPVAASSVGVFGNPAAGQPTVEVSVFAAGRQIAAGRRAPDASSREQLVRLDHPIPAGRPVRICVGASGGRLTIYGAGAQAPAVVARGVTPGTQFALVLTRQDTFLGSLSTAFSRAAIFRPSWVGGWTFWLLLALLACTLPLAGVAVVRALDEPEPDENSHAQDSSS